MFSGSNPIIESMLSEPHFCRFINVDISTFIFRFMVFLNFYFLLIFFCLFNDGVPSRGFLFLGNKDFRLVDDIAIIGTGFSAIGSMK